MLMSDFYDLISLMSFVTDQKPLYAYKRPTFLDNSLQMDLTFREIVTFEKSLAAG